MVINLSFVRRCFGGTARLVTGPFFFFGGGGGDLKSRDGGWGASLTFACYIVSLPTLLVPNPKK